MAGNKVAVLLEDLMSQFRTTGEGLQMLNEKVDTGFASVNNRIDKLELKLEKHMEQDKHEHQQLMQMVKELDTEVVQIKRIK